MEFLTNSGLEEIVDNEDYYSLLNASRESTAEELKACYRRLCMVYHPDKHEHEIHKEASDIFRKIQTAYSVLSDPTKRHIYDLYGKQGLEADWQIVERRKTPLEIREEFERLQRLKAQHKLEERTNPKGNFSVTINAACLFDTPFDDDMFYEDTVVLPEITKMSLSQSIEAPLTLSHTATLSANLASNNGNGSGSFALALRSVLSEASWGEFEFAATDAKQFNFTLKGYRNLGKGLYFIPRKRRVSDRRNFFDQVLRRFALVHIPVRTFFDNDIAAIARPDLNCTVGHVLGKDLFGSLDLGLGSNTHLSTNIVKETPRIRLNAKIQLGFPHSFVIWGITYKLPEGQGSFKVALKTGTFGGVLEYGGEHKVSEHSTVAAHVSIGVPLGVIVKLKLNRASHTYMMPIILSDEANSVAAFYGTVVPIAFYAILQALVIRPFKRREKEREQEESELALVEEIRKKQTEAESLVEMMKQSTRRKIEFEERKMGLIIVEAWYGCFLIQSGSSPKSKLIDVKIPVQNLVEKSTLQLPEGITKSGLPGFYDPCPARDKKLKIVYKFRGGLHQVIIDDKESLRIPLKSHVIEGVQ